MFFQMFFNLSAVASPLSSLGIFYLLKRPLLHFINPNNHINLFSLKTLDPNIPLLSKPFCCRHIKQRILHQRAHLTTQPKSWALQVLFSRNIGFQIYVPAPWKEGWTPPCSPGPWSPPPSRSTLSGSVSSTASFFLLASSPRSESVYNLSQKPFLL